MKRLVTLWALILLYAIPAQAGSYITNPKFTLLDDNGELASGACVYFYEPGTTTKKTVYTDVSQSVAASNPITLDSRGEYAVFGTGSYKIVANAAASPCPTTPDDVIWSADNVFPNGNYVAGDTATVASIAELRGITGTAGSSAIPLGWYAVGDGGGGPLRTWDTASTCTDNGGNCVKPTVIDTGDPGRWVWDHIGPVSPRWFGAKCDGTTDDGAIINTAMAYKEGAQVWIEEETCATSITIEVPSAAELKGVGGGQYPAAASYASANFIATPKSRIVALAGFSAGEPVVRVKTADAALYTKHNVSLKGLMIDCAGIADYGLDVISVKNSNLANLLVYNPVLVGIREDVLPVADATTEGNNATQFNKWENVVVWSGLEGTTVGWRQAGTNSHNINQSTYINCGVVSWHGDALQVQGADSNTWISFKTYTFGKGVGVRLYGSDDAAAPLNYAHHNAFFNPVLGGLSATGTAQSGAASTITLAAAASANSEQYSLRNIKITSGTGVGQQRNISSYDGGTKIATVDSAWEVQPNSTSVYAIYSGGVVAHSGSVTNSQDNAMYGYHTSNAASEPIIDSGVRFTYTMAGGASYSWRRFTPTVTFVTPGDLSVSYATARGKYQRDGHKITFSIKLTFTPIYTTASGGIRISGLPFNGVSANSGWGMAYQFCTFGSSSTAITWPAGVTQVVGRIPAQSSYIQLVGMGSATTAVFLGTTHFPTGVAQTVEINGTYEIDA
jgi:hypothetical protein